MRTLVDNYNRNIDYLRISVTDRCNLKCLYCMPEYGIEQKPPCEILTFEEIAKIVKLAVSIGINKIKITGGEPLVRKGLPRLIGLISSLAGLKDLCLTTNGVLLEKYAKELKIAGLKKLNISIDTLDTQKYEYITRFGKLKDVLRGIDAASEAGFFIKLNVVIMKGLNDNEILDFVRFGKERHIIVRFIELMPIANTSILHQDLYMSCAEIERKLKPQGNLEAISANFGNGPARYYKIENTSCIVGFISPISCKFCLRCNRLRLTSTGMLMPCLASDDGFDLKCPLRRNKEKDVLALINKAILAKPPEHNFVLSSPRQYLMSQIGG